MKIGIVDLSTDGWSAGGMYSRVLATSLKSVGADAHLLTDSSPSPGDAFSTLKLPPERYLPGEWTARRLLRLGKQNRIEHAVAAHGIQVVAPLTHPAMFSSRARNIAWIPDFQPFFLRDLYDKWEIAKIEQRTQRLLEGCDSVILSSDDSKDALGQLFPKFAAKARVLRFPSHFAFDPPSAESVPVSHKYDLPARFLLVANQFWKHKNHVVVPEAISILRKRGVDVPCVMTGLPADFRDRSNTVLSEVLQKIASLGIWDLCRILGLVPRADLVALLRTASALVQPSLFEGWNTTIQDALALGCPILASDLPVHREQCGKTASLFDPKNPAALADAIEAHWAAPPVTRHSAYEAQCLTAEKVFAAEHGRAALAILTA